MGHTSKLGIIFECKLLRNVPVLCKKRDSSLTLRMTSRHSEAQLEESHYFFIFILSIGCAAGPSKIFPFISNLEP